MSDLVMQLRPAAVRPTGRKPTDEAARHRNDGVARSHARTGTPSGSSFARAAGDAAEFGDFDDAPAARGSRAGSGRAKGWAFIASDDLRDLLITTLVVWLLGSVAVSQSVTPDVARDDVARDSEPVQRARSATAVVELRALIGRPIASTVDRSPVPEKGAEAARPDSTRHPRVGRVIDLIVDLDNSVVAFAVIEVDGGPRTALAWHALDWTSSSIEVLVAESLADLRSRAEVPPDLGPLLQRDGGGEAADRGDGAKPAEAAGEREAQAREPQPPETQAQALPRLVLASELAELAVTANDGVDFGRVGSLFLSLARGDLPFVAVKAQSGLHVVPWSIVGTARGVNEQPALRLDRPLDVLQKAPRLDEEDVQIADRAFQARVYRAVGLEPPPANSAR